MSWKDEEFNEAGTVNEYIDDFEVRESCLHSETKWVDAQHKVYTIKGMGTNHILNCIRGIQNGNPYYGQAWKLRILKEELSARGAMAQRQDVRGTVKGLGNWITDRLPCATDTDNTAYVYNQHGAVTHYTRIKDGEAWMTIPRPEPYVKPKRFKVTVDLNYHPIVLEIATKTTWAVVPPKDLRKASFDAAWRAAEQIAAMYEDKMMT